MSSSPPADLLFGPNMSPACLRVGGSLGKESTVGGRESRHITGKIKFLQINAQHAKQAPVSYTHLTLPTTPYV